MNRFETAAGPLRRDRTAILQINVGKLCNQTCMHCHVNAGPGRKELMTRETIDRIVDWLARTDIPKVDITGGAPEIIPDFRYLVERVKVLDRHIMDHCNLTIFFEPGHQDPPGFLTQYQIEAIASLLCYSAKNVFSQHGNHVFEKSVRALLWLNKPGMAQTRICRCIWGTTRSARPCRDRRRNWRRTITGNCKNIPASSSTGSMRLPTCPSGASLLGCNGKASIRV